MANCEITDRVGYFSPTGTFIGQENQLVYAVPDASWRAVDASGSVYRPLGINPNITTEAYQRGRVATTDSNGEFTFNLPYPAAEHPASPTPIWTIVLPSGDQWEGIVPAVAGPLTLDDLRTTYSWVQANSIYVAPVTPGTLVRGIATFTAAATVSILFSVPFTAATYNIKLTPSVDSGTGTVPVVGFDNQTTTGFDIVTTGVFTGTVCWEAVL